MANPFDIHDDVWVSISDQHKISVQDVYNYDLSWLVGKQASRFGVNVDDDLQKIVVYELKKFLLIKILYDPHPFGMISPLIGAMWHTFVLHTAEYEAFSYRFYGKLIHHVPGGGTGQQQSIWLALYRNLFGEFPDVWSLDGDGSEVVWARDILLFGTLSPTNDMDSDDGAFP